MQSMFGKPALFVLLSFSLSSGTAQQITARQSLTQGTSAQQIPPQGISAPQPQPASIVGTATDMDGELIPGAAVTLDGPSPSDHQTSVADAYGVFHLQSLRPAVRYRVILAAKGFAPWTSPELILSPGQTLDLASIPLAVGMVETSVSAVTLEELAIEQVKEAEQQRIFGFIPNFYVVYSHQFAPLSPRLKFELALRNTIDPATIGGTAFLALINQASGTPAYHGGMKGYGQRFGAVYAGGVSSILIGGAVLPTLLHQDPRYFYKGTGTRKARALYALSAPFITKGDNGRWQPNYSSLGGDFASSALANTYYPPVDRGVGLIFSNALVTTGGRAASALAQEFLLNRLTSHPKPKAAP